MRRRYPNSIVPLLVALATTGVLAAGAAAAAPSNTSAPTISGLARPGEELTASNGTWTGDPTSFAHRWQRCDAAGSGCSDVGGATGTTYGVRGADVGHTLRVTVTASNGSDQASAQSAATAVVRRAATPAPNPPRSPRANKAPRLTLLSARGVRGRIYVRFRVCDDGIKAVAITERDSKQRTLSYVRRFSTVTAPRPCGVYSRSWRPAPRFAHGRLTVSLQARDTSGKTSRVVHRTFVR